MALNITLILFGLSFIYSHVFCEWILTEELGVQNEYNHLRREATKTQQDKAEASKNLSNRSRTAPSEPPLAEEKPNDEPVTTELLPAKDDTEDIVDKFRKKTAAELGELCLQLKNSKVYIRDKSFGKFPNPEKLDKIPSDEVDEEPSYMQRPLKSFHGSESEKIRVFPCRTHVNRTYWITYGFLDFRVFLLKEVDDGKAVAFVGLGEQVPKLDAQYSRGKVLDNYFYQVTPKNPSADPKATYPFVNSVQFRLCSLIHAAKLNADPKKESFTINYADSYLRSTFHRHKVYADDKNRVDQLEVRTLGCAINRKGTSDVEFYLHLDSADLNAVFTLELKEHDREQTLFLMERFTDLNLPLQAALTL